MIECLVPHDRGIEIVFNGRDHSFSSSSLRKRVVAAETEKVLLQMLLLNLKFLEIGHCVVHFLLLASGAGLWFAELTGSPNMNTTGWNLTGAAATGDTGGDVNFDPDELILTNNIGNSSGAIFYNQAVDLGTCYQWNVQFDFRMFDGNSADGIAFCFLDVYEQQTTI